MRKGESEKRGNALLGELSSTGDDGDGSLAEWTLKQCSIQLEGKCSRDVVSHPLSVLFLSRGNLPQLACVS